MIFPDGTKREGYFENNVYKVQVQISESENKQLKYDKNFKYIQNENSDRQSERRNQFP
jgi:hypothetical protein